MGETDGGGCRETQARGGVTAEGHLDRRVRQVGERSSHALCSAHALGWDAHHP